MNTNPGNILTHINSSVPGSGFLRDIPVNGSDWLTNGGVVIQGGTPTASQASGAAIVVVAASAVDGGKLNVFLPGDYDGKTDKFRLRLLVSMAGALDDITLDATIARFRVGTSAVVVPTAPDQIPSITGITLAMVEFAMDGRSLLPEDAVTLDFTTGTHTTDAFRIWGGVWQYSSNLAITDIDARS